MRTILSNNNMVEKMENSSRFFCNRSCEYFPCHKGVDIDQFNCLFCYCPLNPYEDCPGKPGFIQKENGIVIKDCSGCAFPHNPQNYDRVISFLKEKNKKRG